MPLRSLVGFIFVATACVAAAEPPQPPDLSPFAEQIGGWEGEIAQLEALDRSQPDPDGAVLLIGSSSIRLWETAAADLAPYPVIRRGYGGAKFTDLAHYAERLITPHKYRAAVVFVANDVAGSPDDHSPAQVAEWFGYVADLLRRHQPNAPVIACDIRPTPLRWRVWDKTRAVNAAIKAECDNRPGVYFLETTPAYLTDNGAAPRADLCREDGLHLNRAGYDLWSGQIKAELDRLLSE